MLLDVSKFMQFNQILFWHYIDIFWQLCGSKVRESLDHLHFWHHLQNSGVPKITLSFNNSLKDSHKSLKAIILTVKAEIIVTSASGRDTWGRVGEVCRAAPSCLLPAASGTALKLPLQSCVTRCMQHPQPRGLIWALGARVLMGLDHMDVGLPAWLVRRQM